MSHPSLPSAEQTAQANSTEQERLILVPWRKHDPRQGFPDALLEMIAARFRLLGEPVRLKLLATLASGERNVGALAELTGAGQPNISKHLAALAEGGLVQRRKVGTTTLYSIADPSTLNLCDVVCAGLQERLLQQARSLGWSGDQSERTPHNPEAAPTP